MIKKEKQRKTSLPRVILFSIAVLGLLLLLSFPIKAAITTVSNSPDPFDNQVAGQTSYVQATPDSGSTAFPDRGGYYSDYWDLTLDIFDSSGNHVRRLWADYLNSWPVRPNTNLPPDFDGRGQWDVTANQRGSLLAYGTYTSKLYQGIQNSFSTKVPTLFLMGKPSDIYISADNTVYVVNDSTKKILRYSADGTLLLSGFDVTMADSNNRLQGVAVNSSGDIYLSEYDVSNDESRIQKYDSGGTLVDECYIPWNAAPCNESTLIVQAEGMSLDSSGNIYVADAGDSKVKKFLAAGGASSLDLEITVDYPPRDVQVDTAGGDDIYIVVGQIQAYNKTNDAAGVYRYDSSGSSVWLVKSGSKWVPSMMALPAECNPLGIGVDSTYFYVSCGCDSNEYLYDGEDLDCGANANTVRSYEKDKTYVSEFGTWGAPGDGTDELSVPHGIGVNSAGTYAFVSESANSRIKKLSLSSGTMTYSGHIFDEYSTPQPTSIDLDDEGNVYVALSTSGIIKKFDADGNLLCSIGGYGSGAGKFELLYGLAVSDDGYYLYASDVNDDSIDQFIFTDKEACDGSWTNDGVWPDAPAPGNIREGPRGLTVEPGVAGASARVFMIHDQNSKIYSYTPAGVRANVASTSADARYITSDAQGYLYIVYENGTIEKYTNTGTQVATLTNASTGIMSGGGITVDGYGNLYVTDRGDYTASPPTRSMTVHRLANYIEYDQTDGSGVNHIIEWQYHFRGNCDPSLATCTPPGLGDGEFNSAWGISVAEEGNYIWVADYGNNRVQKFDITYLSTKIDQITIGDATAAPDVSAVNVSPVSPVPAGQLEVVVSYNKSMLPYQTPSVEVITQNNCQLPVFDEAVILDANGDGIYNAANDTVYIGLTPAEGALLSVFLDTGPLEGFIDYTGGTASNWDYLIGEALVADNDGSPFSITSDNVLFASQTTPNGIPIDLAGLTVNTINSWNSNVKHSDGGPNTNVYDGYYVTNEWKGWVNIPSGSTDCCGGSCDGVAQVQVANGKDAAGTIESPNPWNINTSTGFQFVIDTTDPTEPTITTPSDGTFTTQNSVVVSGSYDDANGSSVTVVTTDFTCVVREDASSLNNVYNAGTDTLIYGSCSDGDSLIPMTTKEGWIDLTANGVYNSGEPIIGNYYDIDSNDPRYDQGIEPCTTCDRILLDLGTYSNLAVLHLFYEEDSSIKVNMTSSQNVLSTGVYSANNVGLVDLTTYYISAVGYDIAGNSSPYVSERVKVTRGLGSPGVAGITPDADVGINTTGEWVISYTASSGYDYPANAGDCDCGTTPSTDANCYITITLPTGWYSPTETSNTAGWTRVSSTGDTQLCAADEFSISGQTIKVQIDTMNAGESIDVTYGYIDGGIEVSSQANLGGNNFTVKAKNGDASALNTVPPETGKTLSINVKGYPLRVSHVDSLPGTIYDFTTNQKVMTLNFENTNTVGSGKSDQVSMIKLKFIASGSQTPAETISRIVAKSGATEYLNTTNITGITGAENYLSLTLADAGSNPLVIGESSVKSLDIYMDFKEVSTLYPPGSTLEFLLDGDADIETGTITALASTVLTDSSAVWTTNQWVSYHLTPDITVPLKTYIIQSNTPTTLKIRSGDMLSDGAIVGDSYAIGNAENHVISKDQITGTSLEVAPRSGTVTDTFYPDYSTAGAEMSSGQATQFKAPPIANGILVIKKNTWAIGQTLSKGQTSTKPVVLVFKLFDQLITSTGSGTDCSPNCSTVFVDDVSVFSGLEGQSVIIGDDDGSTSVTIAPGGIDSGANAITFAMPVGPYYKNKNMYLLRQGASAKISRLIFSFYECGVDNCDPTTLTTNPKGLMDRVALRQTGSNPAFYYVNKADSSLESSGSTVTLDFSTYLSLSGSTSKSLDLLLDIDPNTTAYAMKTSLINASKVYPNSRKQLTNNCTSCSQVFINNSILNDLIQNERVFITTDGSSGEWSVISGEASNYIDVLPAFTGSYTTDSYVEHSLISTGYESGIIEVFPLDSLDADILNSSELEVVKMYVRDTNDVPLCPNTEAGTGTDNPELYYGTSFKVYLEVKNKSTSPSSIAYVDTSSTDLSFVRFSDSVDYSTEFVLTQPSIVGGTCVHQACMTSQATAALVYTVVQSGGTTVAPTDAGNYFAIDTNTTTMLGASECDVSKDGLYKPKAIDSNDYTDTDKFCINTDSDGVGLVPPDCQLSIKIAEAYVLTDPVPVRYVGAGSTLVPVLNFIVYDGASTGNSGQVINEISFTSLNSTDTYVADVQLWRDDNDSNTFEPYVNSGTDKPAKQFLSDDCDNCSVIKVNDASQYSINDEVALCYDSACTSDSEPAVITVVAVDTTSSPNVITLDSSISATIDQAVDEAFIYNKSICGGDGTGCDVLVGTASFSGGVATITGISEAVGTAPTGCDGCSQRFFLTYNIGKSLDIDGNFADGVTIDAAIAANGIKFAANPAALDPIPNADVGSSGSSKIDIVAVMIEADPPSSQSCIQGNRQITFKAFDIYRNRDNGSYGNPVTFADANLTVTLTEEKDNDSTDFVGSSLIGATFSPSNPPGDADQVEGNLSNGIGTVTITDVEASPPENVTINLTTSLTYKPIGGAVTTFGNNVCINAQDITGLEPPAGQVAVPIIDLQVINGLAESISIDSVRVNRSTLETLTDEELESIKVWYDADDDEICDVCYPTLGSGDTLLSSGNYTSNTITFSGIGHTLSSGEIDHIFITYDLDTVITDGRILDAEIPINGLAYSTGTTALLDQDNISNSAGTSKVNIVGNTLEIYPHASTASLTIDCDSGSGAGVNCLTVTVEDVSIFQSGDTLSIQDDDSEIISPFLTIDSVNPSYATSPIQGTVTFTSPATGTYTIAQNAFISNTTSISKSIIVRAIDSYGNIASEPSNSTFEASTQITCTADTTQPDPSDTKVTATDLNNPSVLGNPAVTGDLSYGDASITYTENSCPPRRVLIEPTTSAAGFTTFESAIIRFPGDISKDTSPPVSSAISFGVTGSCITSGTPELNVIEGEDDCSGIAGMRFACSEDELDTAPWVTVQPAQVELDLCCNCNGDARDIGCGFDVINGLTCLDWDGTTCTSGWISNTGDPDAGCGDSALKTVYVQLKDKNGNISVLPAQYTDPPVIIDNELPAISSVAVYSNSEAYFYGSSDDGALCNADPQQEDTTGLSADCKVWFNNLAGEGDGQITTIEIGATDNNAIGALEGDAGFGLTARWDYLATPVSPAALTVSYDNISAGDASESLYFTVYDTCSNTMRVRVDFDKDNEDPDAPAVSGYDTGAAVISIASGTWYNYTNPYFEWAATSDLPSGVAFVDNAGMAEFKYSFTTNAGEVPTIATSATSFTSTATLTSGYSYYLRMAGYDNVYNFTAPASTTFIYKFDNTPPDNPAVSAYDTSLKAISLTDSEWYSYTNPYFEWAGATDLPALPDNSGLYRYVLYLGTDPAGTPDYATTATGLTSTATLVSGNTYYLRMNTQDNAGNATTTSTLFTFNYDNTAPNNPTLINACRTSVCDTVYTDGNWYKYPTPYFEWSAASDLPAAPGNSGVSNYYVYFGTDETQLPTASQVGTTYTATVPSDPVLESGYTYYLIIRTEDNVGNISATTTLFTYKYDPKAPEFPPPSFSAYDSNTLAVTISDATSWYNYPSPYFTWADPVDPDCIRGCSGLLGYYVGFDQNSGFDPTDDPSYFVATGTPSFYDSAASGPTPLVSGYSYYLIGRVIDNEGTTGNINPSLDPFQSPQLLFTYKYDSTPPNNPTVNGYDNSVDLNALTEGNWYTHANPYFEWAGATDLPLAPANSGFAQFNIYFGTSSTGTPTFATTVTNYTSTMTLESGYTYYLRMSSEDNAGNATTTSTVYTFNYDATAPNNPDVSGYDTWSKVTGIVSGEWYNYPSPFFEWAGATDLPSYPANSGFAQFNIYFGDDPAGVTDYATTATKYEATASLSPGYTYYLRMSSEDNAGNSTTTTTAYSYKYDPTAPNNPEVLGYDSSAMTTSLVETNWYGYSDPYFDWDAATDMPDIPANSGFKEFNLYFGTDSGGTPDIATTTTYYEATQTLTTGYTYYLRMSAEDNVGNATSTTTGFYYQYDISPPDNPDSVLAWATDGKNVPLTDGGTYQYDNPYFEWAAPADNPSSPASAGIDGYYVSAGTDPASDPVNFQTSSTYTQLVSACNEWVYLRIRTRDRAIPSNATGTYTAFRYYREGDIYINDNQSGDDVWRNAAGTTYDVDFQTDCGTLDYVQYSFWSGQSMQEGTGTEILPWTTVLSGIGALLYDTDWAISSADFDAATQGINYVSLKVYNNTGTYRVATDVFYFKKDTIVPTILTATMTESNNYMWISPADSKLYYGLGMGSAQAFTISGTATDSVSGIATATFSPAFDDTPADDVSAEAWTADYDIDATNVTAASMTISLYDMAGNVATTTFYSVQNNNLTIQYSTMTPPLISMFPTFVKFNMYYPDGVTQMVYGDPNGLYATTSVGVDTSNFVKVYDADGGPVNVYDDPNDVGGEDFVVQMLEYQTGALDTCGGTVSGTNAWCLELYSSECVSSTSPHYIEIFGNNIPTDSFLTNASEKTIDGDLGVAVTPSVTDGDAGTFQAHTGPDYLRVYAVNDGLISIDTEISSWCAGGACTPACATNYCSDTSWEISDIPDFVKRDTGAGALTLDYVDIASIAAGKWAWDSANKRIMVFDDPTSGTATMTATLNSNSETVCVELMDACDQVIDQGRWDSETVQLTLSQAPGSGSDITSNDVSATQGFYNVTVPAAGFSDPDQLTVKGDLYQGRACVTLTADSLPTDSPRTPIKITPTYFGSPALEHNGGVDKSAYVLITEESGVASGSTSFDGVNEVSDVFISTPDMATQSIVIAPEWSHDGSKLAFISRQTSPCDGNAATGSSLYTDFNIYTFEQSAGTLSDCTRLTSNSTDGFVNYGVTPSSELTWSPSNEYIVFSAGAYAAGTYKLYYVNATSTTGVAVGSQYDYPPVIPSYQTFLWADGVVGAATITVMYDDVMPVSVGDQIIIYENDGMNNYSKREIKTITGVNHVDFMTGTEIGIDTPLTNDQFAFMSMVDYPVTLDAMGKRIVPVDHELGNANDWQDPDWSGTYAECHEDFQNKLIAIRTPSDPTYDVVCSPACVQDATPSSNANIVMIDGTTDANGLFSVDGATSNLSKITNFTNDIWVQKAKWSPDCTKISFLAWDRSAASPPSMTSVYFINYATDSVYDAATITVPITSLSDTGVYKVYDYASHTMPAYVPNWSADGKLVSYSVDKSNILDLTQLNSGSDVFVNQIFGSSDFDSYLEYILDQPDSQGNVFAPQIVGQVMYNELDLVQCPGHATSVCPNKPNTPYVQVAQVSPDSGAYLRMLTMSDSSSVSSSGGLLFQDGIVTAVFPPNVVASDTIFFNTAPSATYCGGTDPSAVNADCPIDPTTEYIVQAGEAREYFPDGTNFDSYVRLIFHYCDNDDDGYIDANTEGITAATSYGTTSFGFDSITGKCTIGGVDTAGGTVDVDSMAVYNWDRDSASWVRMDGLIDKTSKTITVFSSHFSRYDTLGFRMGTAPPSLTPLQLVNLHTYPNPYKKPYHSGDGIRFAVSDISGDSDVQVEIRVYDIRGSLVITLFGTVPSDFSSVLENGAYTLYNWTNPINASGRPLASGVYMYYLIARDLNYEVTEKGKFTIVK